MEIVLTNTKTKTVPKSIFLAKFTKRSITKGNCWYECKDKDFSKHWITDNIALMTSQIRIMQITMLIVILRNSFRHNRVIISRLIRQLLVENPTSARQNNSFSYRNEFINNNLVEKLSKKLFSNLIKFKVSQFDSKKINI